LVTPTYFELDCCIETDGAIGSEAAYFVSDGKRITTWGCMQSAYRSGHTKVLSDIFTAIGSVDFVALALLDLSAAFDTGSSDRPAVDATA
jgi:hypothetical protein